jgi:hypothetical protein
MIYVSQIYDTVLSSVRKDKRGLAFSPDDFNNIAIQVNQRVWRKNYHNFESSKLSIDEMDSFLIPNFQINLDANGVGVLPTNYFHMAGDPWYTHPTEGRRKIDLVTTLEYGNRELDYLTKSTALYPTCYMGYDISGGDMALHVTPASCTPVYMSYLRQTVDSYLDYYVNDKTLEVIYMIEGAPVAVPVDHTAPAVVVNGVTLRAEIAGPNNVTSYTKNFEWHPHDVPSIISLFLQAVGISLPDELLVQVGNAEEIKVEKE